MDEQHALTALTEQVTRLTEAVTMLAELLPAHSQTADPVAPLLRTWSLVEAAGQLGVTASQLRTDVTRRRVPHLRVGSRYRFTDEQLHEITQIWTVPAIPEAPDPWGRSRRAQDEEARRWAHHRGEPMPSLQPPIEVGTGPGFNSWGRRRRGQRRTPQRPAVPPEPRPQRAAPPRPTAAPAQSPVTVRCPGSGKSVQLDKPTPPRCPSCRREDLEVPRFSPSRAFGLVPAHGKTVPAGHKDAGLPLWPDPS